MRERPSTGGSAEMVHVSRFFLPPPSVGEGRGGGRASPGSSPRASTKPARQVRIADIGSATHPSIIPAVRCRTRDEFRCPTPHKVTHKRLLRVAAGIDLRRGEFGCLPRFLQHNIVLLTDKNPTTDFTDLRRFRAWRSLSKNLRKSAQSVDKVSDHTPRQLGSCCTEPRANREVIAGRLDFDLARERVAIEQI